MYEDNENQLIIPDEFFFPFGEILNTDIIGFSWPLLLLGLKLKWNNIKTFR